MIDKTRLKHQITWAIKAYADSELLGLSYHDPANNKESAHDAMKKLIDEAHKIAGYALLGLERKDIHNP